MVSANQTVRLAAVGDIHYSKTSQGASVELFAQANQRADVLLLCGDLTDYGLAEEARVLAKDLAQVLTQNIQQYEERFGPIPGDPGDGRKVGF